VVDGLTPRVIVVVGPTAAGKSELAESLARRHDAELVSADALQLYRGLDIGTAKPGPDVRSELSYHGLDLYPPTEQCTAARYGRWARATLAEIGARGRTAILVGGSGFYIRAALEGLDDMPGSDPAWREALTRLASEHGVGELHRWLRRLDPAWAERIDANDRQRLLRALEVVLREGRRLRDQRDQPVSRQEPALEPAAWIGLRWDRAVLTERIAKRVEAMLQAGWADEVEGLLASGVPADAHALQAIGYRDLVECLRGGRSLEEVRSSIVIASRQYAKRQMTWFRREHRIRWFDLPHERGGEGLIHRVESELGPVLRC
jgi:tRNA dimethylallyltransferase